MKILVLDSGMNQTAYLVAELVRAGVDTTLAAPRPPDPRGLGRLAREIESPSIEEPAYRAFLEDLLQRERFDLVLPTIEPLQQLAWSLPAGLAGRVFPSASEEQQALLADRRALYAFVEGLGVPIPRHMPLADQASLEGALAVLGVPCVLRGTQGVAGQQVKICKDSSEARDAYRFLLNESPEPPFAQEFLDGRRCLFGGLFDHGKVLHWFSQVALEVCPPPIGPAVRVRSRRDPVLTGHATRIFEALRWDGLACAEFIQLKSGEYRFLEVNPRAWAAIQAAHVCGAPLLRLFVDYLLGRYKPGPVVFADGVECTLFPAFFTARIRMNSFPRLGDLKQYWQSLASAPWSEPALMRSFLRLIWWTYDAQRQARRVPASR